MMNDDGVVHGGFIHQSFLVSCYMAACKHASMRMMAAPLARPSLDYHC